MRGVLQMNNIRPLFPDRSQNAGNVRQSPRVTMYDNHFDAAVAERTD